MNYFNYFHRVILGLLVQAVYLDGTKVTKKDAVINETETENPFPFISLSEDGQVIVEAYPMGDAVDQPDTKLDFGKGFQLGGNVTVATQPNNKLQTCHHTHSLLDGQSIQFRSRNYPSPYPENMSSLTCFESPHGTKISMSCSDFNVDCKGNYFGISSSSFGENSDKSLSRMKQMCRNDTFTDQISSSNFFAVVFASTGISNHSTFNCVVSVIGSSADSFFPGLTSPIAIQPRVSGSPSSVSSGRCNCGRLKPQTRIVGGTVTEPNEFPWRCYIVIPKGFCGCALISDEWVMTAAHCTQGTRRATVILGAHQKGTGGYRMTTIPAMRIINHPRYNSQTLFNDISLVKLRRIVNFTDEISPICLPWNMTNDDFSGSKAVTSGWGSTRNWGYRVATSNVLRKAELSVISPQQCSRVWGRKVTNQMLCAHWPNRATCSGDSGGSLDLYRNGHYYGIGITSFGDRCKGRSQDVFTRVTSYLNWIQSTTKEDFCKI